jgi:hexosaminidase
MSSKLPPLFAALVVVCALPIVAEAHVIIPAPAEAEAGTGAFRIALFTRIVVPRGDVGARAAAGSLTNLLARATGVKLQIRTAAALAPIASIVFERQAGLPEEGYALEVSQSGITIAATTDAGLYYGAVTLWQLMPTGADRRISAIRIHDAPAYPWRGLMLDSARHFQEPDSVKRLIDAMGMLKLNVLHWHLTDDQGWRLEIRRYPKLTSVGAFRVPATVNARADIDPSTHAPRLYGGYYSQTTVRKLVAYAAEHHVLIVPEIEMPGHAQAAIAAYPELGSMQGPAPAVSSKWGVHNSLFNVEPATFTFLEHVLDEVMALFPSPYIHVGGDEAVKDEWNTSSTVQARMRALGIADADALQAYFTRRMGRFLASHHRRLVGWDEILNPSLSSDAIVMSWRGTSGAQLAAIAAHDAVLAPWPALYFDNRQSRLSIEPPGRLQVVSLEDVYRFEPHDASLTDVQQRHILGVQANLWTEHIATEERLEWMALPRAAAVAEVGWTSAGRRHWPDFLKRLASTFARYRALGLHYADSAFAVDARLAQTPRGIEVSLANQAAFGNIHYTTDGQDPRGQSPAYSAPFVVPYDTDLRAATFLEDEPVSNILRRRLDSSTLLRRTSRELDLCSDAIGLNLESSAVASGKGPIFALDILNPCWIYRGVELTRGVGLVAAVGPLPFNFEVGAEVKKIRTGDAHSAVGELEVRIDDCNQSPVATVTLAMPAARAAAMTLPRVEIPARPGRHDICLRFARPRLDPMWALDWVEIRQ